MYWKCPTPYPENDRLSLLLRSPEVVTFCSHLPSRPSYAERFFVPSIVDLSVLRVDNLMPRERVGWNVQHELRVTHRWSLVGQTYVSNYSPARYLARSAE